MSDQNNKKKNINNMKTVSDAPDIRFHFWVPTTSALSKVDACLKQFVNNIVGRFTHESSPFSDTGKTCGQRLHKGASRVVIQEELRKRVKISKSPPLTNCVQKRSESWILYYFRCQCNQQHDLQVGYGLLCR